tara:strand:- start:187 stop:450 length:264 start_codon:yes stop_codon:yes gene_type:complete
MAVLTREQIHVLAHHDPDTAHLEEIILEKKERAQSMAEQGYDEEEIKSEIWSRPNEWCQGTCGGFNTWESHNLGLDMCWECKLEAMD